MSLANVAARARVLLANAAAKLQTLQVRLLAGEIKDGMEHFEPFGFTAVPQADAEAIALFLGGDRSHGVIIAVGDRRYRVTDLSPGESAMYNAAGHKLVLYQDRAELIAPRVVVKAAEEVFLDTPLVRAAGRIEAAADVVDNASAGGRSMAHMRSVYDGHTHHENDNHGETNPPTQKTS